MSTIQPIPVIGFETTSCHDIELTKLWLKEIRPKWNENMVNKAVDSQWGRRNIVKLLAYFPLSGTFIGAVRIFVVMEAPKEIFPNRVSWIIRGAIEFFSLGFLLFIPDLIMTIGRSIGSMM